MSVIRALILGLVQGLTEFIPVSSSGHLVLVSKIFGIESEGIAFEVLLHAATLAAVFAVFWKDIMLRLQKPFSRINLMIILSTAITGIMYFLFKDIICSMFDTGEYIGFGFLATGIMLFFSEMIYTGSAKKQTLSSITIKDSAVLGIAQGIAIIPGVSRSGTTISAGLALGLSRENAIRYSFLLSIPAILGGVVTELPSSSGAAFFEGAGILPLVAGFVAAFAAGYVSIKFLIRYITQKGMRPFAYYVSALGILLILDKYVFRILEWGTGL